jgi:hypothetical protein
MRLDPGIAKPGPFRVLACIGTAVSSLAMLFISSQALALAAVFGDVSYGSFGAAAGPYTWALQAGPSAASNSTPLGPLLPCCAHDQFSGPDLTSADPQLGSYGASLIYQGDVNRGVIHAWASGTAGSLTGSLGAPLPASASVGDSLYWLDTITMNGPASSNDYTISLRDNVQLLYAGVGSDAHYSSTLGIVDLQTGVRTALFQCQTAR